MIPAEFHEAGGSQAEHAREAIEAVAGLKAGESPQLMTQGAYAVLAVAVEFADMVEHCCHVPALDQLREALKRGATPVPALRATPVEAVYLEAAVSLWLGASMQYAPQVAESFIGQKGGQDAIT